jgi:hypothetical protein
MQKFVEKWYESFPRQWLSPQFHHLSALALAFSPNAPASRLLKNSPGEDTLSLPTSFLISNEFSFCAFHFARKRSKSPRTKAFGVSANGAV